MQLHWLPAVKLGYHMRKVLPTILPTVLLAAALALIARPALPQPGDQDAAPLKLPQPQQAAVASYPGLHNVVAFSEGIYSGSVPEASAGFESLKALGIKTVLSVDGAIPDVASAEAQGLRYVHLPITYAGMTDERKLEIARAVRDLPHPIYIHCHHGKHRSAAATGAAAVTLGLLTPEQAAERMKVSGTAPSYKGLWKCVALSTLASADQLERADATFPKTRQTSSMVQTMVEIDEINDHLKLIEAAGWTVPNHHPDLVPAAEAGRMADAFRTLHANDPSKSEPGEFLAWLDLASTHATTLEESLVASKSPAELSAAFKLVGQSCKDCHAKYRD